MEGNTGKKSTQMCLLLPVNLQGRKNENSCQNNPSSPFFSLLSEAQYQTEWIHWSYPREWFLMFESSFIGGSLGHPGIQGKTCDRLYRVLLHNLYICLKKTIFKVWSQFPTEIENYRIEGK